MTNLTTGLIVTAVVFVPVAIIAALCMIDSGPDYMGEPGHSDFDGDDQ